MKNKILKVLIALGFAASMTMISTSADAYYYRYGHGHGVRVYYNNGYYGYHRYPVEYRYYKCVGGYWKNHVWHPRRCW